MSQIKSYPSPSKIRYRLERFWLRKWFRKLFFYFIGILFFFILCVFIFVSSNDLIKFNDIKIFIRSYIFERPELSVSKLEVKNANSDLTNQITAILQLSFPINSIQLDIKNLQQIINNIDSVESSHVRITDNGILVIEVVERLPVAVYRNDNKLSLIDIEGLKINNVFSRSDRKDLPLIIGSEGNLFVKEALEIYKIFSSNIYEIRGIMRIGKRRWDVILNNNKRIKLPETNPKTTLKQFLNSNLIDLISFSDLSIIDLRLKNRIVLRKKNLNNNKF